LNVVEGRKGLGCMRGAPPDRVGVLADDEFMSLGEVEACMTVYNLHVKTKAV
jgi:hypothetical protein